MDGDGNAEMYSPTCWLPLALSKRWPFMSSTFPNAARYLSPPHIIFPSFLLSLNTSSVGFSSLCKNAHNNPSFG